MFSKFLVTKVFLVISAVWAVSISQELSPDSDKTLSPYFLIQSEDPQVDRLPLLATSANVTIAGVIADVKVTQRYKNEGRKAIEAIYVFPASTRAAVYGMRMTIGKRTVEAVIKEKQQARAAYEEAKQQGKSASLLEQQRPNVFQMNIANIMPGDTIKVELRYTELLVPVDNIYEFVYPTVVGPRYSNKAETGAKESDTWTQNPYLHAGQKPTYAFDIRAEAKTGVPIQEMTCPSHKVNISYDGPAAASINLDNNESNRGNRDFILKYRLTGSAIESGLLLYKGEKENFFLLMVQPPKKVSLVDIPKREYIFVIDVSGSMNGFPLDISKELLKNLISGLQPTDCFNVVLFAGGSSAMAEKSLPATAENIRKAIRVIDEQQGGGGTELLPALKRALSLPRTEHTSRSVIIATDGYVDVEPEAFELIRNNLNKANMFAFGIGTSVNRHLIEGMARVGGGEPFIIDAPANAHATAEKFREYIQSPVLTQLSCTYQGFSTYDVEPISIPDVLALRPIIIFGKWKGNNQGSIILSGHTGNRDYSERFEVNQVKAAESNAALRYLWARSRIATLGDFNLLGPDDKRVKEITNLGLAYNLLTAYTSFVAIDNEQRNKDGTLQTVKQALPLPEGVSDLAVGGLAQSGYGSGTTVCKSLAAAPRECYKRKAMVFGTIDGLLSEKEETIISDVKLAESPQIATIDPLAIKPQGKTIMYFWTKLCITSGDEIESILRFASRNPDINILIVNLDDANSQAARQEIMRRIGHGSCPVNVSLVFDPKGITSAKFGVPNNRNMQPIVLFMVDGMTKKSIHGPIAYWSDDAKVRGNFAK